MPQKLLKLAARTSLLEAAKDVLRDRGYAALTTREVATAAGVPLSQIHYHFGSKQGLMLALFEYLDAQLLERQQAMYSDASLSLADQWERACAYLDEDLASGYVRIMQELAAAGWADAQVGAVVRKSLEDWIGLVIELARRFEQQYGRLWPLTPEEVGALVSNAFIGAESLVLTGLEKKDVPIRESLRRVGALIRDLERRSKP